MNNSFDVESPSVVHDRDFSDVLDLTGVSYILNGIYFQVGEIVGVQGWILHMSTTKSKLKNLISLIVPFLVEERVSFKIIRDYDCAQRLNSCEFGASELGKLVAVYPDSDENARRLASKLVSMTLDFRGVDILTDFYLGGAVYTRYGGFNPIYLCDISGQTGAYIYDVSGNFTRDEKQIPFQFPNNRLWPFAMVRPLLRSQKNIFLKRGYKVMSILKSDAKGNVMAAIRLNGFWIQKCVIKEGRHDMSEDGYGRDMRDRIRWQYQMQSQLQGLPVPRIYDLFEEEDNVYIVMDFVKGRPLLNIIYSLFKNSCWYCLDGHVKINLLGYLLKVVSNISELHNRGYLHRDITPTNFLYSRRGEFVMIDLELAFALENSAHAAPFALGTRGYMSPQQQTMQEPSVGDDIYGLGGLMIALFANMSPGKFCGNDSQRIFEMILFLTGEYTIATLIAKCHSYNPDERPTLLELKNTISAYRSRIVPSICIDYPILESVQHSLVESLVSRCLRSFADPLLRGENGLWYSNCVYDESDQLKKSNLRMYSPGLYSGASGVMFVLSRINSLGVDVNLLEDGYKKSYEYIRATFSDITENTMPGLYSGSAGAAVAVATGIKYGLLIDNDENRSFIRGCLLLPSIGLDIAVGAAGQGIAIFHCLTFFDQADVKVLLDKLVGVIVRAQARDGSWPLAKEKQSRFLGLSRGVSGIILFLLEYYRFRPDNFIRGIILRALTWLRKWANRAQEVKKIKVSLWLGDGWSGITLCFLKAYQILSDSAFRDDAERYLKIFPDNMVYDNLSLSAGIAGVGDVYLEAFKILGHEWIMQRCHWITNILIHTRQDLSNGSCSWQVDHSLPTADLMNGVGGIVYYLTRYRSFKETSFCLLPGS